MSSSKVSPTSFKRKNSFWSLWSLVLIPFEVYRSWFPLSRSIANQHLPLHTMYKFFNFYQDSNSDWMFNKFSNYYLILTSTRNSVVRPQKVNISPYVRHNNFFDTVSIVDPQNVNSVRFHVSADCNNQSTVTFVTRLTLDDTFSANRRLCDDFVEIYIISLI